MNITTYISADFCKYSDKYAPQSGVGGREGGDYEY